MSSSSTPAPSPTPHLSPDQLTFFLTNGYIVLPLLDNEEVHRHRKNFRNIVVKRTVASHVQTKTPAAAALRPWKHVQPLHHIPLPPHLQPLNEARRRGKQNAPHTHTHSPSQPPAAQLPPYLDLDLLLRSHLPTESLYEYTKQHYATLTSTQGAGGVLDIHYDEHLDSIRTKDKLANYYKALLMNSYGSKAPGFALPADFPLVDFTKCYSSHDRVCLRLPLHLSLPPNCSKKQSKKPVSRCLTPHLDCCPDTMYANHIADAAKLQSDKRTRDLINMLSPEIDNDKVLPGLYAALRTLHPDVEFEEPTSEEPAIALRQMRSWVRAHLSAIQNNVLGAPPCAKFRPIQCFVSLSDTTHPDTGGIEIAPGYHKTFDTWTKDRGTETDSLPPGCQGMFTAVRNPEICRDLQHIPVPAGSCIFWDNKLVHATAREHNGADLRMAIYCSFLPQCSLNEAVVLYERRCRNAGLVFVGSGNWISTSEDRERQDAEEKAIKDGKLVLPGLEDQFKPEKEWVRGDGWEKALKSREQQLMMGIVRHSDMPRGCSVST